MTSEERKNLYFAGPLFSEAEKRFNLGVTQRLEREFNIKVFLPQRDGMEFVKLQSMAPHERTRAIFKLDKDKVFNSDVFLYVLDGRVPDEGAALELGLAFAHRELTGRSRIIVGLFTDARASFLDQQLNPMIAGPFDRIVHTEDELVEYIRGR